MFDNDLFYRKLKAGIRGLFFFAENRRKNRGVSRKVVYITESADWAIKWVGFYITKGVSALGLKCETDIFPHYYRNALLHLGSLNCFRVKHLNWYAMQKKRIITVFHGDYGISREMDSSLSALLEHKDIFNRFVVSNSTMERRLGSWGVDSRKIVRIPIGVDLGHFKPLSEHIRARLRKDMGIPEGCLCVGSFQKDGIGWGEGAAPKWIKGPDIFVEAVERVAQKHKVHCLLTGPARGYVKQELEKRGISYTHKFVRHYFDLFKFYNCLDLYLVTSREEGGPKSILESMATSVPVVSTPVGMAVDIVQDGVNGFIAEAVDVGGVVEKALYLTDNAESRIRVVRNGLDTVKAYEWGVISSRYHAMYTELLNES